jgi:heterodisulfide reductase subunit B
MSICPVCNGMEHMQNPCPSCHYEMEDAGKLESFYGPYSPYQEWGDIAMTNGYLDQAAQECLHIFSCPHCGLQITKAVKEISAP